MKRNTYGTCVLVNSLFVMHVHSHLNKLWLSFSLWMSPFYLHNLFSTIALALNSIRNGNVLVAMAPVEPGVPGERKRV